MKCFFLSEKISKEKDLAIMDDDCPQTRVRNFEIFPFLMFGLFFLTTQTEHHRVRSRVSGSDIVTKGPRG